MEAELYAGSGRAENAPSFARRKAQGGLSPLESLLRNELRRITLLFHKGGG
jgi:hypothetical protein